MIVRFLSIWVLLLCSVTVFPQEILKRLQQVPEISDIRKLEVSPFAEYYSFRFEQPVDHGDASKGSFRQRVLLGHKTMEAPVIAELEGYQLYPGEENELSGIFKANQLNVEHRFFEESVPEGDIPWDFLTIRQAAADHHAIIQALKKYVYTDNRWISTGISKGGQTTVFHRYFYPEDVDLSVPYVAPLNLDYVDPRLDRFLGRLGSRKKSFESIFGGGSAQVDGRYAVRDFQLLCFSHKNELLPMFTSLADKRKYTFSIVGGAEKALDLIILEYPFAFWQWGHDLQSIPTLEDHRLEEIFGYLMKISDPTFFEDSSIRKMWPFFYAALTETGMYDYKVKPFRKYLDCKEDIDFSFALPEGAVKKPFNRKQMLDIEKWLQTDAEHILFVYGGSDPWYATGVDLKDNGKCRIYVRGDMSHKCRIRDFDPASREDLILTLKEWLDEAKR